MKKTVLIMLAAVVFAALAQCSKRKNPVDSTIPQGLVFDLAFSSQALSGDIVQDPPARDVAVYTPPGYNQSDTVTYPVLYLLHGFGGDQNYYTAIYSVGKIIDEMIADGEIQPMIVVTPNADNVLGGGFYTNSYPLIDSLQYDSTQSFAGLMQDYITDEIVPLIDSLFRTRADRQHRGISGHSMGGYGAVKLAMIRNDLFGSASSMSAPLAFWGAGPSDPTFHGFVDFFPFVFAENNFTPGDTAAFYSIAPGTSKRLTNMMFAMASAFTPHDPANLDTTYAHLFSTQGTGFVGRVDLPFGADGQLAMPIWNHWMAHDVTALYQAVYHSVFDNTDLYVDAGAQDDLYLNAQSQVFAAVAVSNIDFFEIYSGFDDFYHADHTTYIGERLRKVLKFHSDSFSQ